MKSAAERPPLIIRPGVSCRLRLVVLGLYGLTLPVVLLLPLAWPWRILLVLAQTVALVIGQGLWLVFLNDTAKIPVVIAASVCAVAGFLLSYRTHSPVPTTPEAAHR